MNRHIRMVLATALLLAAGKGGALDAWCPGDNPAIALTVGSETLQVEVADDRASRRCGLSNRSQLPEDSGMLFVFETDAILTFWMEHTDLPLSIAFMDSTGRIIDIQQMRRPNSRTRYRSPQPARYALETGLGWFASHGIGVGDYCRFVLPEANAPRVD